MQTFWGKTPTGEEAGDVRFKPVIHHLLDVSATALRLQKISPSRTSREARILRVDPERLTRISAWLAGLHDLGKFSRSFQAKVSDLWPVDALGDPASVGDRGHWRNTAIMLRSRVLRGELEALFPDLEDGLEVLIDSVAGHHGRPPGEEAFSANPRTAAKDNEIGETCLGAALEAMKVLHRLVDPKPVPELAEIEDCRIWSWRLAGLTTFADWIGSDSTYFTFEDPEMEADDYWPLARERAERAIAAKGLVPAVCRSGLHLSDFMPQIAAPRPMQALAEEIGLDDGPQLVVIEDTTGSGKTEAALILAGRMMAVGKGEGIYFALPTMATANAMYGRLGELHRRLFAEGEAPSLVLAHGRASLGRAMFGDERDAGNGGEEQSTAAYCAQWITDSRRKAFFAQVGAGTIDQAFLAVLRKKFLTLRQYGLAGRILIVDEAHAFDAYMWRELEALLGAHAALGGSAIVLSATLPGAMRQKIASAFRKGVDQREVAATESDHYPLLTAVSAAGLREREVSFCEDLRRTVAVERLSDAPCAHETALAAAREGAAVLVLRNAVDEAIGSFEALSAAHQHSLLFHARFAICDRQRIEEEVLTRFGRDGAPDGRRGQILVATQVVEQSLDLDFELVISDLAPIDLLIQRAGRLWRHMDRRPAAHRPIPGPRLLVISPSPSEANSEKWLEPALGAGAFVYRHPGVMWRTAEALFAEGEVRTPDNLRQLISRVYDEADIPQCLERGQNAAEGERYGQSTLAGSNLIYFSAGYPGLGALSADQEVSTRLGEEMATLRLARRKDGRLVPWSAGNIDNAQSSIEDPFAWAQSEISVRKRWLGEVSPPKALEPLIAAARSSWPDWDRAIIAVVEEGARVALERDGATFTYDPQRGLLKRAPAST